MNSIDLTCRNYTIPAKTLFISLIALSASLPLLEAPKNLFALTSLVSGLIVFFQYKLKLNNFQKILIAWLAITIITSLHAKYSLELSTKGITDVFRFTVVGIASSILIQVSKNPKAIILTLLGSTAAASLLAGYNLYSGANDSISLKSVGHVNQSAIYACITLGLSISFLFFSAKGKATNILLYASTIILAICVLFTDSRAAIAAACLAAVSTSVPYFIRNKKKTTLTIAGVAIVTAGLFYEKIDTIIHKQVNWQTNYLVSSYSETPRGQINIISKTIIKENPILGIGYGNFTNYSKIEAPKLIAEHNLTDVISPRFYGFHPHNMYYETIASLGMVGSVAFLILWLYVMQILWRFRPVNCRDVSWEWMTLLTTTTTTLSIGLFNNPMHHESAILIMIIMGICTQRLIDRSVKAPDKNFSRQYSS